MAERTRYGARDVIEASMRALVRGLDLYGMPRDEATSLVDWFESIGRLALAGKTLAARRAVEGEPWVKSGERSAADWLAKRTSSTVAEARTVLDTAAALRKAPATDEVFRAGALSVKQAEAVATAVAADPSAEARLLAMARSSSLQKL